MDCSNRLLLRNSYPSTISPTFSYPPMTHHTSPSANSSPHRTDFGTFPHSSPIPLSLKMEHHSTLRCVFLFHLSRLDSFRSSIGPSARWSPFHISYAFPLWNPPLLHSRCAASAFHSVSPFSIVRSSRLYSHWFSVVVAYPEPYLDLRFFLCSVLYKVTQPLVCSLASSTQSSLVSSLPRFALRPTI